MLQLHLTTACLLVFLYSDPLHGAWELSVRKNTLIVDVTSKEKQTVIIECNAQSEQSVHWRRGELIRNDSATLTLRVREEASGGNFTCHAGTGAVLDYRVVLVNEPNREIHQKILTQAKDPIQCTTKNYNGNFTCSWKTTDEKTEFIFKAHRYNNSSIISCDEPVRDKGVYTVQCRDEQSCHYAEEDDTIIGELHAIQQRRYENYTLAFMLREITKPDPPQDLNRKKNHDHHVSLHWKYPKTWCHVHSFFPLLFNLKMTDGKETSEMQTKETNFDLYEKDIKSFCVQAKDMFFNSSWSEWECSNNDKEKKKTQKGKKNKSKKKKPKRP